MELEYQRNLKNSYMILREEQEEDCYESKVLEQQVCNTLLPMQRMNKDGKVEYWYDVSGKQSLELYLSVHGIEKEFFQIFFIGLSQTLEWIERYLLDETHLVLSVETIFWDADAQRCSFCYCLSHKEMLTTQIKRLMESILKKINHEKKELVMLVYELYDVTQMEDYTLEELKKVLERTVMEEEDKQEKFSIQERVETEEESREERVETEKWELSETSKEQLSWKQKLQNILSCSKLESLIAGKKNQKSKISTSYTEKSSQKMIRKKREQPLYFEPEEEKLGGSHPTVLLAKKEEGVQGILYYEGHGEQEDIRITNVPFLIGSDADKVQGVIQNDAVSRVHAKITKEGDVYFIEDLNSTNGTFLDRELLNYKVKAGLNPNSKISFANERYCFR